MGGLVYGVVAEPDVNVGSGVADLVGVLSFNPRSGNTGITVFDVKGESPPHPYVGFVTTNVPGEGYGADLVLHEGFAYVASGEVGLQVIDLGRAAEAYRATKPSRPHELTFKVSRDLFTRGVGFGREAIINKIAIRAEGVELRANTVAVARTDNHGLAGMVGGFDLVEPIGYFTTVDLNGIQAQPLHKTIRLQKDELTMSHPYDAKQLHLLWRRGGLHACGIKRQRVE